MAEQQNQNANVPFRVGVIRRCGTTEHMEVLKAQDPSLQTRLNIFEGGVQARINVKQALRSRGETFKEEIKTVPLIIHIVYNTDRENISDEQIQSQVDVLNADFSRTNADAVDTPPAFQGAAADTRIRFCLVKVIRQKTNQTAFSSNNDVKFTAKGGSDAADPSKYFNVWVCNLQGLLGYGEFPNTILSKTYGVVVKNEAFGTGGITRSPYNKGRTLTHEIAHSLNVYHIFAEGHTSCSKTDKVYDIPSQSNPTYGCPSFPKLDNCALNSPGIMFMNYMDYTNDACMNCFTKDQADRMRASLETFPYNNLSKTGCETIGEVPSASGAQTRYLIWGIVILALAILLVYVLAKYVVKIGQSAPPTIDLPGA